MSTERLLANVKNASGRTGIFLIHILVTDLTHDGEVTKKYKLPDGVKCIVGDGEFLYVGCNNGALYGMYSWSVMLE